MKSILSAISKKILRAGLKRAMPTILALLTILGQLVFFNILPMPCVSEKGFVDPEDPIYFTAHRGVNAKAPENSLPAYQLAIDMGYYTVETDIRLTKDGVWVISHNENIGKWYNGKVNVSECTYEELLQYKVKSGHGVRKYDTLRIPTLEEYLDLFVGTESRPQIEIKTRGNDGLDEVMDMIDEKGLSEQAILISFDLDQLHYIRSLRPDTEIWYLCGEVTDEAIEQAQSIGGNVWLSCDWSANSAETMQKSIDAGVPISMWTVDSIKDAKRLYEAGFRYMETDRLCP